MNQLSECEISDLEISQLRERTHEKVEPAMYFIGQIVYDILDTLGQTDPDVQSKLQMLFMLYDKDDPRFAIIQEDNNLLHVNQ